MAGEINQSEQGEKAFEDNTGGTNKQEHKGKKNSKQTKETKAT